MKKFTFLSLAVAMAATMSASGMMQGNVTRLQGPMKKQCSLHERISKSAEGDVLQAKIAGKRAVRTADTGESPVSNPPAGTVFENMYVTSQAYGLGWGDIYYEDVDGGLGGVDVANDGFVYVQGPLSQAYVWGLGKPWIKCEKQTGDTIVMHLPQVYCIDGGDPYYLYRMAFDEENSTFVTDSVNQDVKFVWKDNTLTQADDAVMGLCDATASWFYMADWNISYKVNTDVPLTVPEGATKSLYKMTFNNEPKDLTATSSTMVNAFASGSDLYIDHMEEGLADAVIKCSVSNGKVTVPTRQYLGADENYNSHVYVLTGDAFVQTQGESSYFNYEAKPSIEMPISESGNGFAAAYPASFIVNAGPNSLYIIADIVAPSFEQMEDNPMTPADPEFTSDDIRVSTNFHVLKFLIPTVDVEGKELNINNLYYNIYYNDAPYQFTPELFIGFTEPMTDLPYSFVDSYYDVYLSSSTGKHSIYFYDMGYSKVGVQSIYRGGGEEHRSNVVWVNNPATSIADVAASPAVKSVDYFNLAGQRISEPAAGVCIKRVVYADGTIQAEKVVK